MLDYDPITGVFRWRVWRGGGSPAAGSVAGNLNTNGYHNIKIGARLYRAHRLAWLYVHGEWPPGDLDHKDGHRDHNWIDNLRPANDRDNQGNSRLRRDNVSGFKGVSFHRKTGKWRATIRGKGRRYVHLGLFLTAEAAHAAYVEAAAGAFGAFARAK